MSEAPHGAPQGLWLSVCPGLPAAAEAGAGVEGASRAHEVLSVQCSWWIRLVKVCWDTHTQEEAAVLSPSRSFTVCKLLLNVGLMLPGFTATKCGFTLF